MEISKTFKIGKFTSLAYRIRLKLDRLTDMVRLAHFNHKTSLGYPCNQNNPHMLDFYRWYEKHRAGVFFLDNAGDPNSHQSGDGFSMYHDALLIEKYVIDFFGPLYGFDKEELWGLVSFSGTDGNNHGIYFGAKKLLHETGELPVAYISDSAHYSNRRLADMQNLEVRLIESDVNGLMKPEAFEAALDVKRPALVVFAIGTTFKGGIDDINAINAILERKPPKAVYRHVDAALFGGFLPFTRYKDVVNRKISPYDSIAVSGHKFFGMDEPCGLFFTTREVVEAQKSYAPKYLNRDMVMVNCSRSTLSAFKFWWIISTIRETGLQQQAEKVLEDAKLLYQSLKAINYPCWLGPASNTVYFKRPSKEIVSKYDLAMDYDERQGGELAHVVVMQHVTPKVIKMFVEDIKRSLQKDAA